MGYHYETIYLYKNTTIAGNTTHKLTFQGIHISLVVSDFEKFFRSTMIWSINLLTRGKNREITQWLVYEMWQVRSEMCRIILICVWNQNNLLISWNVHSRKFPFFSIDKSIILIKGYFYDTNQNESCISKIVFVPLSTPRSK